MTAPITLPMSFGEDAPGRDRGVDQLAELLVGDLLGQVALDQLGLGALRGRLLVARRPREGLGRLDPLLALPLEHRDGVPSPSFSSC